MTAPVQLQSAAGFDEENRSRNDAVKLLARPIDIRGAGENDGELVLLKKCQQVQIASGTGSRIRCAWVEAKVFGDEAAATAIDLRSRNMDVFANEIVLAKLVVQANVRQNVGLIPMLWIKPAFSHHALGGEVEDIIGTPGLDEAGDSVRVLI